MGGRYVLQAGRYAADGIFMRWICHATPDGGRRLDVTVWGVGGGTVGVWWLLLPSIICLIISVAR